MFGCYAISLSCFLTGLFVTKLDYVSQIFTAKIRYLLSLVKGMIDFFTRE